MSQPRLKTLRLCVADLEMSAEFYGRLFNAAPSEKIKGFVAFDIGGTNLEIVEADDKNPLSTGGSIGYFAVDDLAVFIESAQALGAEIWRGPLKVNETGLTILQIKDGGGNVIGFEGYTPRP